jgi:hypothetical protein
MHAVHWRGSVAAWGYLGFTECYLTGTGCFAVHPFSADLRLNKYRQSLSRATTACEQVRWAALERNEAKIMTKKSALSVSLIVLVFFLLTLSALAQAQSSKADVLPDHVGNCFTASAGAANNQCSTGGVAELSVKLENVKITSYQISGSP